MANQQDHANNLKTSRAGTLKKSVSQIKKGAKTTIGAVSLMAQINPFLDWLFAIAFMAALLKDILDIVNTALIAAGGIGAVLIFIFTLMASAVIIITIFLTGSYSKTKEARTKAGKAKIKISPLLRKLLLLAGMTLVEIIPIIDLMPLEAISVYFIFKMTLEERKLNAEKAKEAVAVKNAQTQAINQSIADATPA
jgi:hypothetical protein